MGDLILLDSRDKVYHLKNKKVARGMAELDWDFLRWDHPTLMNIMSMVFGQIQTVCFMFWVMNPNKSYLCM